MQVKNELSQTLVIHKCRCDSVWCPTCFRHRKLPKLFSRLNDRLDWRSTRHVVLTIDRDLFDDGESAYLFVTQNKKIPQLIHNLKRTKGFAIRDYVWVLEWHKDGFPHWHIFIDVNVPGRAGQIHFSNILKYWGLGNVKESYFKDLKHWNRLVGYFGKHGYFEKKKAHQAILPEWAKNYNRTIKRTGSGQLQSKYENEEEKKNRKEKKKMIEKRKAYKKKESRSAAHRNGWFPDDSELEVERKPYKVIFEKCGQSVNVMVCMNNKPFMGFSINIPYKNMILKYPMGTYEKGVGYVVHLDSMLFQDFVHNFMPQLM